GLEQLAIASGAGPAGPSGPTLLTSAGVASVPSMTTGQFVTLDAGSNALTNIQVYDPPQTAVTLPWGLFSFDVAVIPGGSATVTMTLPSDAVPSAYYKQDPQTGRMLPFMFGSGIGNNSADATTGAEINGNVITLHLSDGANG